MFLYMRELKLERGKGAVTPSNQSYISIRIPGSCDVRSHFR